MTSGCTEADATDLGTEGPETTLPNDGCAKITVAMGWAYTAQRLEATSIVDNPPVPFDWSNDCGPTGGSDSFTATWQSRIMSPIDKTCTTLIDFTGSGGNIRVRWYVQL